MGGSRDLLSYQPGLENLIIRSPLPEDDQAAAELLSLGTHVPMDAEALRDRRRRWSNYFWFERLAEIDGEVVGRIEVSETGHPDCGYVRLAVKPCWRGRGVGSRLFELVSSCERFGEAKLFVEVRDNDPASLRFALSNGFVVKSHAYESVLDLCSFERSAFEPYVSRARAQYRIATVAELGDTEENRYKLWEVEHITDHDIPGIDLEELPTWETARTALFTSKWYDPAGEFVLLDGDRWIGICGVAAFNDGEFYNQHTAVLKEYRGQGLAIALKVLATDYVKSRGGRLLRTNNHAGNESMLAINHKFGYRPEPGWYELKRERKS